MKRRVYIFILCSLLLPLGISAQLDLTVLGTYATGEFDEGAAEIVAYNEGSKRLYSTNGSTGQIDVIDISDPENPALLFSIDLSNYGDKANSVTTHGEWVAMAVEADNAQDPGSAVFTDLDGNLIANLAIGSLPDHISVSENGRKVMVACEGEPDDDYLIDPMGTVAVINVPEDVYELGQSDVTLLDFSAYNNAVLDPSIRVNNNPDPENTSVAKDLEPEFCAFSQNGQTGYVSLQENNAIAIIDLKKNTIVDLVGLGFKDHSLPGNGLDASNRDDVINIQNWPVWGMYQPDAIKTYKANGQTYIVTANEGDARDYDGYSEEARVKDLILDTDAYPDAATLQLDENLGRLNSTTATGDTDGDGDVDQIFAYGARSFSIWDAAGNQVYDSGDDFEQITATAIPDYFNSNNDDNDSFDSRSDDKGPEPEAIEVAKIKGNQYAFIGLERVGGIMIYNITDPYNPYFINYINNRDFTEDAESPDAGDLGPEDIVFIPRSKSPTNDALLVVSNEVSGTVTLYAVEDALPGNAFAVSQEGVQPLDDFKVFPNPASWDLNISLPDTESPAMVRIFDTHGKLLWTRQSGEYQRVMRVDLAGINLQNGMYVVTLTAGKQTKARPFQVQR